jgi:putative glutamine amidotransferase
MEDGKPVLGVCRGMQVINVAAGGSLVQDCGELFAGAIKHDYFPGAGWARDYLAHGIRIAEGSRLQDAFGVDEAMVNSMHHQGICDLGHGLVASAWAPDGLVEAVEASREDHFLVGVQWHPEMLIDADEGTKRLFEAFIEAANQYRDAAVLA